MNTRAQLRTRHGFTLVEILVALVLLAAIAAILLPSVIGQADRGEINRTVEDLRVIGDASRVFRVDVKAWPGSLPHLITQPLATDQDVTATAYGNRVNRWDGPYLEIGAAAAGLPTGFGGTISSLGVLAWGTTNTTNYFTILVTGLTQAEAEQISDMLDGDPNVDPTSDAGGRVRYDTGTSTLNYLVAPSN